MTSIMNVFAVPPVHMIRDISFNIFIDSVHTEEVKDVFRIKIIHVVITLFT